MVTSFKPFKPFFSCDDATPPCPYALSPSLFGGFVTTGLRQNVFPFNLRLIICLDAGVWVESVLQGLSGSSVKHGRLVFFFGSAGVSRFWAENGSTHEGWRILGHPGDKDDLLSVTESTFNILASGLANNEWVLMYPLI